MDSSLLYFYSTIPQIVAAIIAFIFVFVIFKLQDYDKYKQVQCSNFLERITQYIRYNKSLSFDFSKKNELQTKYQIGYLKDVTGLMTDLCDDIRNINEDFPNKLSSQKLETITSSTRKIEEMKKSLISWSIWICAYGFFVIICSIVVLYFVKLICLHNHLSMSLFICFIILTSIFLALVLRLLIVSLRNKEKLGK